MIQASVLASGSSGNAVLVVVDGVLIIIDPGISIKRIKAGCERFGLLLDDVKDVFRSHDHTDHTLSYASIRRKYLGPGHTDLLPHDNIHRMTVDRWYGSITMVRMDHDIDCHGFVIQDNSGNKLGYITDTATMPCESLGYFLDCGILIVETNHDPDMLVESKYPDDLKIRIMDTHLSNQQAADLVWLLRSPRLKHIICHHLSENANDPRLAMYEISKVAGDANVIVAPRHEPTEMVTII